MAISALVSTQNHVEAPFIIVKIGNYTFGHCTKIYKNALQTSFGITYPNYMESLDVVKVNGAINTYTINMIYAITQADDPNRLEKVFSSVSNSRTIKISYGDWNAPAFIYKEEQAIITKLTTRVNLDSSTINYTLQCTSTALPMTSGLFSFPARTAQPSSIIIELLNNKSYGLQNLFAGMLNKDPSRFIATDDQIVQIEAKPSITLLDYINYLVSCMVFVGDSSDQLKTSCYFWSTFDDFTGEFGGTYFKVQRVSANTPTLSYNTYEIDVGYPTSNCVLNFTINNDDSWSLLYNYSKEIDLPEYTYRIDDDGKIVSKQSSLVTSSTSKYTTNEATRNWWSLVTQFPITATLTMKGLLRPAMLMSYVKLNVYFYGHKHVSSGLYVINKQQDSIKNSGYRTTLSLIRIGGDEYYA